ncbi:hypothetical protein STEPF1_05409 [Streptomyces sp. F-1]|nr:hypothetical protein STEPF1_05409 [Streptomyces sp. F-1]
MSSRRATGAARSEGSASAPARVASTTAGAASDRMCAIRSAGKSRSSGRKAPPASVTPSMATTASAERGTASATTEPRSTPRPVSSFATPAARAQSRA